MMEEGYNLAIVGSRNLSDWSIFTEGIIQCCENWGSLPSKIVSGGAKGADFMAAKWANENNIDLVEFVPNWRKYGNTAGIIRNQDIIESCDKVLAFPSRTGKGTQNSILRATEAQKQMIVIYID